MDHAIVEEKTTQASAVLDELGFDCWLTFCRESDAIGEPSLPFVLGYDVVWPAVVLLTADRDRIAILGENDATPAQELGVHDVYTYRESLEPILQDQLATIDPDTIAINYAEDFRTADGLTHGMYRRLVGHLDGTPYADRFVSASDVIRRVRGRKSPTERDRIYRAAETTEELLGRFAEAWEPDWTEAMIADWLHDRMADRDLGPAWSPAYCPAVDAGDAATAGHTIPGDRTLPPGEVLHFDFGVRYDGYTADLQRCYYRPSAEAAEPPVEVRTVFQDVRAAIDAGIETIEPGRKGRDVDAAARETLTDRGWPEPNHGIGHEVGREAHDGGTLFGPPWEPYGASVEASVHEGGIYAVELGVDTEYGYIGLEDMIEVTESGVEYVVEPQRSLRILGA
ncbi:MAG: M24 family metallopeptidase [Halobacteriales archaeon]|nr:M24 family metallopeptidase [Halobacteriales archaeon]